MNCLWTPSRTRQDESLIAGYMRHMDIGVSGSALAYDDLWEFSVNDPERFWSSIWDFIPVLGHKGERTLVRGKELLESRFFPDARLNFAENLLRHDDDRTAVQFIGEDGSTRSLTYRSLRHEVASLQSALRSDGVGRGDRVAGVVANVPEAIVAMLATASLGAVWSSCSPDFGSRGILDRFGQIEPSVLFTMDGYHYGGKWFGTEEVGDTVARGLPGLIRHVRIPYGGMPETGTRNAVSYQDYLDRSSAPSPDFVACGFNDPLFILFSSGTTGLPKCIIHSGGGALLQHAKEHQLNCDIRPGDRVCYFTTAGWMMWNWMVSSLGSGASVTVFDGMPMHPDPDLLPGIVDRYSVTHFGASAKYFDACSKQGVQPVDRYGLEHLRVVFSTGSPLAPATFDYVYRSWKSDLCLSSIAGGTDILGCFVGGSPISPVYRGQCQKRILGMDVQVYDEMGRSIIGDAGELVCRSPHPTIPIGFYNDPDGRRFRSAYFEKFPGVWHHGDWVELTPEGGMVFHGRSDATLNPSGVRIGTSEIYRPVEQIIEVMEALVIAREIGSDVEIVLFVRLAGEVGLDPGLEEKIRKEIRSSTSPRHVPRKILAVPDIPRTKSGKIVELAVKDVVNGREVGNRHALANPEALEHFRNHPGLQD